jgi:multidrug efflux pump subunit AcrA (membrane-fusion protein)
VLFFGYDEVIEMMKLLNRQHAWQVLAVVLLLPLLVACAGASAVAQQEPATPTPLPPAPALERPTYVVERGSIARVLEINGRIMPVDMVRLSFRRDGRVERVHVQRGDTVQEGDILAELQQDSELGELRRAEKQLVQAQRDLEEARSRQARDIRRAENSLADARRNLAESAAQRERDIASAERSLQRAQEDLARLQPDGTQSPTQELRDTLEEAQRNAKETRDEASRAKTDAEIALREAAETLEAAQRTYSDAYWDWDWVQRYGTDPDNEQTVVDPASGEERTVRKDLNNQEERDYEVALIEAEEALIEAEENVDLAQRDLELAREEEIYLNKEADKAVADAQRELDEALAGEHEALISAERAVVDQQEALAEQRSTTLRSEETAIENAQLELAEAQEQTFDSELSAIEDAEVELEEARKTVDDGRIIAPQSGEILALSIGEGDEATAFDAVVELADPSALEAGAELSTDQMRQIQEGQPAEVSLLSRPDVMMPALIRRMPAPYGSGGSGAVREEDQTTRFAIEDTKGQNLTAGTVVKIRIVLERKDDVLLLPPEALRSFEGRRFVMVREGDTERRVPVELGIETDDAVEILDGVDAGATVVGQ